MAKVKIQGHASGTGILTVTAPNTSTDRTITLPDATGTLLNSDGSGANLTSLPADATKVPLAGGTMTGNLTVTSADSPTILMTDTRNTVTLKVFPGNTSASVGTTTAHDLMFYSNDVEKFRITSDGRGLSQFTAKAWCKWNGSGTIAINASHNVSSIVDQGTGTTEVLFDVNHSTGSHCTLASTAPDYNAGCTNFGAGTVTVITENLAGSNTDITQNMVISMHL